MPVQGETSSVLFASRRERLTLLAACGLFLSAWMWQAVSALSSAAPGGSWRLSIRLDLNGARPSELCELPHIGNARARKIDEYRRTHGPLDRIEVLKDVAGLSDREMEEIRPLLAEGAEH
jgi:hypothetical protein